MVSAPLMLILLIVGLVVAILAIIFILVPLLKGVGWIIGNGFKGIGLLIAHLFEFIFGVLGDAVRFVGSIPVFLIFGLLGVINVVIGRWSAAGHFAEAASRECKIAVGCLYRIGIRRPLKLILLHGLLEGVEERVPQAMEGAPGKDKPSRRTGQFDGYQIIGSLRGGGSGGKLYIAEPTLEKRAAIPTIPDRVVIKSFALSDGSSLPQIVRESRALECAKQLGHVIEHGMSPNRFHYVMPYIPGDHLGIVTRDLHAKSDSNGLSKKELANVTSLLSDLLATLSAYHKGGFWHKDVKPENVIINEGRAHLVDLGLVTSLRSAMTLTTHGTEYFRDPEMVRQALRGVKVHQVDGAKFDIFAAGAVLYFMLENTFPAHGGLSSFDKKSPDALHWIVRRAMAEYHQRYESADVMLADLHCVASASDPFEIKPVDLPSMKGSEIPPIPVTAPDPTKVVFAGSPMPPKPAVAPQAGPAVAAASFGSQGDASNQGSSFTRPRRPRLRVTNWWTGEYTVEDAGTMSGRGPGINRSEVAAQAVSQAREAVRYAHVEARRAGRSAKEQILAAKQRVHDARSRAHAKRYGYSKATAEKQPSPALIFATVVLVAVIVGAFALVANVSRNSISITVPSFVTSRTSLPPVMVVVTHPDKGNQKLNASVQRTIKKYDEDYYVYEATDDLNAVFSNALSLWEKDKTGPADETLEDLMEKHNIFGVINVSRTSRGNVDSSLVYSKRPNAAQRRLGGDEGSQGVVFVINDYTNNGSFDITSRINQLISEKLGKKQSIITNTALSNKVRKLLESIEEGIASAQSELDELLKNHGIGAVLWVDDDPSDSSKGFVSRIHTRDDAITTLSLKNLPKPHASTGRLLVVNNHPAMINLDVIDKVKAVETFYQNLGYELVQDVDTEAALKRAFEDVPASSDYKNDVNLDAAIKKYKLDVVVLIDNSAGDGSPSERFQVTLIEPSDYD